MKVGRKLLFISLISFFISSCTFYKPTVLTTPVVQQKGELILGGSIGSTADGFLLYSPIQNLAIMAEAGSSYTISSTTTVNGEEVTNEVGNFNYEFSAGYYDSLSSEVLYQLYAGYAFGESGSLFEDAEFTFLEGLYSAEYTNPFIQASMQFEVESNFFLGLSARANFLEFDNFNIFEDSLSLTNSTSSNVSDGLDDPSRFVGQLGFDFRYRGDRLGAFAGMQYAFSPEESGFFDVRNYGFHFGVYLRIDSFYRKD